MGEKMLNNTEESAPKNSTAPGLRKASTGIQGLDDVLYGGLPQNGSTLICGGPGCGKTLLAMEVLVRGATRFDEPGVFVAFEETQKDLITHTASLGFDLPKLIEQQKLSVEYIHVEHEELQETGEFDLEGLFIRISRAIDTIGAKRVVLDTLESLISGLPNPTILRSELRRLFRILKDKGVTVIITGERGDGSLTRRGLEEYVSDCVILLDHRVTEQLSTRRLRVVKYRGSRHGTDEYPFLIDDSGFSVLPVTSTGLTYEASSDHISSGIPRLDGMLAGEGFYRNSTILISGTAGSGKSSVAAHFAEATCKRGERCLVFAFEESESQIIRNMRSIGIDLETWIDRGLLKYHAARPSHHGLEMHLVTIIKAINDFKPSAVIMDPVNSFTSGGSNADVKAMLLRLVDYLKEDDITAFFTSLTTAGESLEATDVMISSLVDTWLLLRDIETNGERNRGLYILKSRGTAHSNQIREFLITDHGVELLDVYTGLRGVLTGTARQVQEAEEAAERLARRQEIERMERDLERKRIALEAQIKILRSEFESQESETLQQIQLAQARQDALQQDRRNIAESRREDSQLSPDNST